MPHRCIIFTPEVARKRGRSKTRSLENEFAQGWIFYNKIFKTQIPRFVHNQRKKICLVIFVEKNSVNVIYNRNKSAKSWKNRHHLNHENTDHQSSTQMFYIHPCIGINWTRTNTWLPPRPLKSSWIFLASLDEWWVVIMWVSDTMYCQK